jgi:peptidoglycan hydrolase-like protein with peptidoglycan-binding domain
MADSGSRACLLPRCVRGVVACLALVLAIAPAAGQVPKRLALVVGNGAYEHLPRLDNPASDARLMATALQSVGFDLIGGKAQTDLDQPHFIRAIRDFGTALKGGGIGLFYYAGHGVQVQGINYLVPIGANPTTAADVDFELVDAGLVLKQMEAAGSGLNIVILDACRNNPFGGRGLRSASSGLAQMSAPRGTLISYATQPGNVALDGSTGHSPFTAALADAIRKPGLQVFQVFNEVALTVDRETSGRQQPWTATSPLEGNFYFLPPAPPATPPVSSQAPLSTEAELLFWKSIQSSNDPRDFQDFLNKFPNSEFASLAQRRLAALTPPQPTKEVPAIPPAVVAVEPAKPPPGRPETSVAVAVPPPAALPAPSTAEGEPAWTLDQRREVQSALQMLGHLRGEIDGEFGPRTRAAIAQFQSFQGEPETGQLSEADRRQLLDMTRRLGAMEQPVPPSGDVGPVPQSGAERLLRAANAEKAGKFADAAYWYRLAAAEGEAKAFTNLGTLMVRGEPGGKKDPAAARLLWLAAAARGEPVAMFNLGAMYEHGIGVSADPAAARRWYELAARHGHPQASNALRRLKP